MGLFCRSNQRADYQESGHSRSCASRSAGCQAWALYLLLCTVFSSSLGFAQGDSLEVELRALDPGQLEISYTLRNNSKQDLRVLTWNTPLEGAFDGDNFRVSYDGKKDSRPVPYRERHVKRAAAALADYRVLEAGSSATVYLDISHGYLTRHAGFYSIQFDASVDFYAVPPGADPYSYRIDAADRRQLALQSNTVTAYQSTGLTEIQAKLAAEFSSCDAGQQSQIDTALTAAETMAAEASEALSSTSVSQRASATRYTTWFGSYVSSRYATVSSHFAAISDATANKQLKFSCGSQRCGRTTFAFVYSDSPYEIFLCPAFWEAELTGTDSRAGTIIHELSHFTILGGTDDHQYGHDSSKQLGATDPARAIGNADSHEYFAENTPVLSMSGGTVTPGTSDPSPNNEALTLGSPLTGSLEAGQWRYFEVAGAGEVSLFNLSADLDLYIGNSARPTASNYQCRPFFGGSVTETCTVNSATTTFIGVTGSVAATFSLVANAVTSSGGGSTGGGSGEGEQSQNLTVGTPISGSIADRGWAYFQVSGAAELSLYNLSADLDLYIGDGANPTTTSYLCRPFSSGTTAETCAISESSGTTYVGINAYDSGGSFSLIANAQSSTPSNSAAETLSVNTTLNATLSDGGWSYYEVTGATSIRLFDLTADLDLYVSRTGTPTDGQYDCRPFSSDTTEETCSLNPEGTSFVAVNAYEAGGSFSLLATAEAVDTGSNNQTLTLGEAVMGSLAAGEWAYYEVTDATEISLFGLSADLDLYVSSSSQPSADSYSCRPFIPGDTLETCSVSTRGKVFIGINAYDSGSYSLVATNSAAQSVGEAVSMEVNQASYVAGDPLVVTMTIRGDQTMDTYAGIVLPDGVLFTISPQGTVSSANGVIPFHSNLQVNGEQTHSILNIAMPGGLPQGAYQACGLMVTAGQSIAEENWLGLNCAPFMVNSGSAKMAAKTDPTKLKKD